MTSDGAKAKVVGCSFTIPYSNFTPLSKTLCPPSPFTMTKSPTPSHLLIDAGGGVGPPHFNLALIARSGEEYTPLTPERSLDRDHTRKGMDRPRS